jgi:Fe-S-cluster containining protein
VRITNFRATFECQEDKQSMWNESSYDCQQCGACCINPGILSGTAYVYLEKHEARQMRRMGLTVIKVVGDSYLGTRTKDIGTDEPVCVAFEGKLGRTCGCSIYPLRPRECRRFQAGTDECKAARRQSGLPI